MSHNSLYPFSSPSTMCLKPLISSWTPSRWRFCVLKAGIPMEIWQHIFEIYCVDMKSQCVTRWDNDGPWLLTRVCREWRIIALSIPMLWSNVDVQCYGLHERNDRWEMRKNILRSADYHNAVEDRLRLQLLRSKGVLLDIFCHGCGGHADWKSNLFTFYLLLINHCDRWRTARLYDIHTSFHALFEEERARWPINRQKGPFPVLRELHIVRPPPTLYHVFKYPLPNLRKIDFPANSHEIAALSLSHTSHLIIADGFASTVIPLLLRYKHIIEELFLIESNLSRTEWILPSRNDPYVELPRLRKLIVSNLTVQDCGALRCITLPILENLELQRNSSPKIDISSVIDMFQRSPNPHLLKNLDIYGLPSSQLEELGPLLRLLTGLDGFKLYITWSLDPGEVADGFNTLMSILCAYTMDGNNQIQVTNCPRLRNLVMGCTSALTVKGSRIDLGRLADMIELRWVDRLQPVQIFLSIVSDVLLEPGDQSLSDAWSRLGKLRFSKRLPIVISFRDKEPQALSPGQLMVGDILTCYRIAVAFFYVTIVAMEYMVGRPLVP